MQILKPYNNVKVTKSIPQVFIGYDDRQNEAYEVCRKSIIDNASGIVDVYPLNHRDLRQKGLFWRKWITDQSTGNYIDDIDQQQFSNQFSHTRFLVPEYCAYLGINEKLALFVDLDFVFFDDIYTLFRDHQNTDKVVSVVQHKYEPKNKIKMDNQQQSEYPKKLWSSLMLFNLHTDVRERLNLDYVNTAKGSELHRLLWVDDNAIGSIAEGWNFIPSHSEDNTQFIRAMHYTEGLPTMRGYEDCKYSRYYIDKSRELI